MRGQKVNKAPGLDQEVADHLQNSGQAEKIISFKLIRDMYETGDITNDYKVEISVTTSIPKQVRADKCKYYRTICLTTHASKILI